MNSDIADSQLEIEFTLTAEEIEEVAVKTNTPMAIKVIRVLLTLILCLSIYAVCRDSTKAGSAQGVVSGFSAAIMLIYFSLWRVRKYFKNWSQAEAEKIVPTQMKITAEGVEFREGDVSSQIEWSRLKIRESKKLFILMSESVFWHVIPRRCFVSVANEELFRQLASSGSTAPTLISQVVSGESDAIEFDFRLTPAEVFSSSLYCYWHRWVRLAILIFIPISPVLYFITSRQGPPWIAGVALGGAVAILILAMLFWSAREALNVRKIHEPVHFTLSASHFRATVHGASTEMAWSEATRAWKTPLGYFVFFGDLATVHLPWRLMSNVIDETQLRHWLRGRVTDRGWV